MGNIMANKLLFAGLLSFLFLGCAAVPEPRVPPPPSLSPADYEKLIKGEGGYFSYVSPDGFGVYARLTGPEKLEKPPYPAVLYLHDGPHSTFFADPPPALLQGLQQGGYLVFLVNYRGSSGYDTDYFNADVGDPAGKDLQDVVAGIEFLRRQPFVDINRIYLMGLGYGGYLTYMTAARYSDFIAGMVVLSGLVDWNVHFRLLEENVRRGKVAASTYAEMMEVAGGDYRTRGDFLAERSPVTVLSRLTRPLLVVHGNEDLLCPVAPVSNFVLTLQDYNGRIKPHFLPGQGHDLGLFRETDQRKQLIQEIVSWLSEK